MLHRRGSLAKVKIVPAVNLKFSSDEHEVRDDFHSILERTKVYELRAVPKKYKGFDYSKYPEAMAESFVKESEHIADTITTSEFVSTFGDDGLFFRHQLRP